MSRTATIAAPLFAVALLAGAGCSKPKPIPTDIPPEPQATQLRDAIQAPIDKAEAVEGTLQDAEEKRRAEMQANGG